ncbi:GNAT family N-acetyltransferase [Kitasatospora sp. NBC_01287]|uniref:GNAT family N-acetyltransferase n=1 Tax=Kitasatospora sp. NBC_01287 TaxID=2903573 RepID=UPI00225B4A93|nr:GNAT family N-acetyltransferase [Kitasatospora sp. NBC_01287]MCX4748987.1 GNAT family N-acetyltransferase [Kitasatospora sp. NBC_01287]
MTQPAHAQHPTGSSAWAVPSAPQETLGLRPLAAADWDAWYDALETAFGELESPERRALWRGLTEVDRSLGVWDGAVPVGSASAFSFRMAVPGGELLPTAGVTMVGVAPTHRRRGVLTALMRQQLDEIHERGESLAVLEASEPAIYGRYGYGLGSWKLGVRAERARVRVALAGAAGGGEGAQGEGTAQERIGLRLADPARASAACERLYARQVPLRPGMLARRPGWERLPLLDPPGERAGHSALRCVLAQDRQDGELLGYARYSTSVRWRHGGAAGEVRVREVTAAGPAARAALWAYLLDLDLTDTVVAENLPVDDPLLHLVLDPRRLRPRLSDGLFVRLVEVGDALRSRRYAAPVDLVLEVADAFCPWNTGRWHLHSAGPATGAACEPTEAPAALELPVRALGSAYLGGVSLTALAAAGLVRELRPGALAEASAAFGWDTAPWLPHGF